MKKNLFLHLNSLLLLATLFLSLTAQNCAAKEISLVTYYPEPVGSFDRLRLFPLPEIITNPCDIGTVYMSTTDNGKLSLCADDGTGSDQGFWTNIGDVWSRTGTNLALDDGNPNSFLGIGTKTPEFKLSLDQDGGILAKGQFNNGAILADTGIGVRFLWYPRKAASFAGTITTDTFDLGPVFTSVAFPATARGVVTWGDALIGDHSVVKGGLNNIAAGLLATVGGGEGNMAGLAIVRTGAMPAHNGSAMTVGGGRNNSAMWRFNDTAHAGQDGAIVLGGFNNKADSRAASVLGGANNSCEIRDGLGNITDIRVYPNLGGGLNNTSLGNLVGGQNNTAIDSTVIGGFQNSASQSAIIIAGSENTSSAQGSIGFGSLISGGQLNQAYSGSFIAGGQSNIVNRKIGGTFTKSLNTVILGGQNNRITGFDLNSNNQSDRAVIIGGLNNTIENTAQNSLILGGRDNYINNSNSVAGGRNIRITGMNTFAWGYGYDDVNSVAIPLNITADNAFVIASGRVGINNINPTEQLTVDGNVRIDNGKLFLLNAPDISGGSKLRFNSTNAIARDVAEIFEATEDIESGDLVMILNQGQKVAIARSPNDKKVIGISSMAPAIILQAQKLQLSNGNYQFKKGQQVPLALKGRVLCKVTNENGAIVPGDLLTLSSTPGHAMKLADKNTTHTSIVAKALEPFNPPDSAKATIPATGKILVFVTLQ